MRGIFLPVAVSALKHEGVLYVRAVLVLTVQGPHGGARQQAIVFAPLGEGKVSATRNQRHVRAVLRPWATGFCVNPLGYAAICHSVARLMALNCGRVWCAAVVQCGAGDVQLLAKICKGPAVCCMVRFSRRPSEKPGFARAFCA